MPCYGMRMVPACSVARDLCYLPSLLFVYTASSIPSRAECSTVERPSPMRYGGGGNRACVAEWGGREGSAVE